MKIDFLEPWVAVGEYAGNLVLELQREISEGHVLWMRTVQPVAQRSDSDEVLFEVDGQPLSYAVVHLTWSGESERDSRWPDTRMYPTIEEWIRDGMMSDHREVMGS